MNELAFSRPPSDTQIANLRPCFLEADASLGSLPQHNFALLDASHVAGAVARVRSRCPTAAGEAVRNKTGEETVSQGLGSRHMAGGQIHGQYEAGRRAG